MGARLSLWHGSRRRGPSRRRPRAAPGTDPAALSRYLNQVHDNFVQTGQVDSYHTYPAHAAFGGYKSSGIGRENHLMMLEHYQQTKNLLVSYDQNKAGFF